MGNFFEKFFTPIVHIQNDQHVMDHFEVCMLGYPPNPPPPQGGGRRLPARPPRFGSTKGGGGVPSPSPPNYRTPLGVTHWLAAGPVHTPSQMLTYDWKQRLNNHQSC